MIRDILLLPVARRLQEKDALQRKHSVGVS
jgi:hypothetical protein